MMKPITWLAPILLCLAGASIAATPKPGSAPAGKPATSNAAAPAVAAAPAASEPPIRKLDGVLVDIKGRGLYTFDDDTVAGKSQCNAQCRLLWPPLMAEPGAQAKGPFTLAARDDGSQQWALRGKPLYRWASDTKYGDHGGNGVSDKWHLVQVGKKPAPASTETPYKN